MDGVNRRTEHGLENGQSDVLGDQLPSNTIPCSGFGTDVGTYKIH